MLRDYSLIAAGGTLLLVAIIVGVCALGYLAFSQFLNKPRYNIETGMVEDAFGRRVTPAPWFVRTFLMFLTDSVSMPAEQEAARTILVPYAPGKYWLGWGWSTLDWLGTVAVFGIAYGLGAGGAALIEKGLGGRRKQVTSGDSE